ncbi:unnamed protein product [Pipistrellus nathusii]|uniref:Uncharacterized protein n=1 Tax=Pipistrellus nathusii TaxID=59473 RepID=A0ABP0AFH7_PIPNA
MDMTVTAWETELTPTHGSDQVYREHNPGSIDSHRGPGGAGRERGGALAPGLLHAQQRLLSLHPHYGGGRLPLPLLPIYNYPSFIFRRRFFSLA